MRDVAQQPGKAAEHGRDRQQADTHDDRLQPLHRLLQRDDGAVEIAELFDRLAAPRHPAIGLHQRRVLDQPFAQDLEQGVQPAEVHPHHAARWLRSRLGRAAAVSPPPVHRCGRLACPGLQCPHLRHELTGAAAVTTFRGGPDLLHQQAAAGDEQRSGLLRLELGVAAKEGADVLQGVGQLLHRGQPHHRGIAFHRVQRAFHRPEQVVGDGSRVPAALQLDERVGHPLGEREALDDVVVDELLERVVFLGHAEAARLSERARATIRSTSAGWNGFRR